MCSSYIGSYTKSYISHVFFIFHRMLVLVPVIYDRRPLVGIGVGIVVGTTTTTTAAINLTAAVDDGTTAVVGGAIGDDGGTALPTGLVRPPALRRGRCAK